MALGWLFAKSAGSNQNDYAGMDYGGPVIATDPNGNSYVTGTIGGAATFGNITLTCASYPAIFVAKFNSACTCLWAKAFGGNDPDIYGNQGKGIDIDPAGNCYVTGTFHGAAGNIVTIGSGITLAGTGGREIFLIKFNPAGTALWARQPTSPANTSNYARTVATDALGQSLIAGYVGAPGVKFGSTPALQNFGSYVAKYDTNGAVLWVAQVGNSGNAEATSIDVSSNGTCFVTGFFGAGDVFGSTPLFTIGVRDIFLFALSATGTPLWVKHFGTAGTMAFGRSVSTAGTDVFLAGDFATTITFGSTTLMAGGAGLTEAYVVKFSSAGNVIWARQSTNSSGNTIGNAIKAVPGGESYVAGYFLSNTSIHFGSLALVSNGQGGAFVVRYGVSGNPLWAMSSTTLINTTATPLGISLDSLFFVYIAGLAQGAARFGTHTLVAYGGIDAFIAKLGDPSHQ